ncbi:MAG: xylulokinase, partial [Ruthenibacterium sp.]
ADIYDCPVQCVPGKEGPALGAAILAGVGAGIYSSVAQGCKAVLGAQKAQLPVAENTARYEPFYKIYRALYPALKQSYSALAALGG